MTELDMMYLGFGSVDRYKLLRERAINRTSCDVFMLGRGNRYRLQPEGTFELDVLVLMLC